MNRIVVGIAELVVASNPALLVTVGLGSCVGVTLRDPVAKIGGLAHIVLPSIENSVRKDYPLKYADSALEMAVQMMLDKGCMKHRIEAKMAGGATMFDFFDASMNIGSRNVTAVKDKLAQLRIPVIASDTGGNYGRTIEFHIDTGHLYIKSAFKGSKVI